MTTLARITDIPRLDLVALLASVLLIGFGGWSNRYRVRWAIHAKADVISLDAVPPIVRPVIDAILADLAGLGFELVVVTRANRAWVRGRPRYLYRAALLNRPAADGATIDWWHQPGLRWVRQAWLSSVYVRLFRYAGPAGYLMDERRVAAALRSTLGRWRYELLADGVSLAAQRAALDFAAGGQAGRPFPFATNDELLKLIDQDTDRMMGHALAKTTSRDRTGRWYRWTWRQAFLNAVHPGRTKVVQPSSGRGFAVMTGNRRT